jgi:hypothetical protein
MAEVTCPTCEWRFEAPEADEWRQRKCPSCGEVIEVLGRRAVVREDSSPIDGATGSTASRSAARAHDLALLGLIPCVGILPAVGAMVFGFRALRLARAQADKESVARANTAVVLGGVMVVVWGIAMLVAAFFSTIPIPPPS